MTTGTNTHADAFGQRLMALFEAVLELDEAAREARISEVADTEPALADAVRALLVRDAETGALRAHLSAEVEPLLREALPSLPSDPQTIGPYAVLRRLGEGGMGRVYLARRSDSPVAQNVAIKLIRSDRVSPGLLDRFEAERRHLAALDHPGICRFIDAASLADGTPYVVMEAVDGVPIIDYCAQRELGVEARLKLLRKLLAAVAHAHDRLLVHRDIKPQNVLVTADGEPKLLDFGIAKSIEAEQASQTRTAERFFTPNASAPEQLLGGAFGVGCDVYALGALAYELLSGHLPFDFDGLRAAEIERLILQVAPPLMSERASTAHARELRGDLDAIVATCLRKSPAERYSNVSALDSDLARYLEGRPVEARAPSWIYRAKLFVRRHRVSVALSGALTLAILGSAATLAVQAFELREQRNLALIERDRALQVVEILESAFRNADPARTAGDKVTARQILDAAAPRLGQLEIESPDLFVRMASTIAQVEMDVAQNARAIEWVRRGIAAADSTAKPDERALRTLLTVGAMLLARSGDVDDADKLLGRLEALGWNDTPEYLLANARNLIPKGQREQALQVLDRAEALLGPSKEIATHLLNNEIRWIRSTCLRGLGRSVEAVALMESTLAWQQSQLPNRHPWVLRTTTQLFSALSDVNPTEDLAREHHALIEELAATFGNDSIEVGVNRGSLAATLLKLGRPAESAAQYAQAVDISGRLRGEEHLDTLMLKLMYARTLSRIGNRPESEAAVTVLEDLLSVLKRKTIPTAPIRANTRIKLANALLDLGRVDAAIAVLTDADEPPAKELRHPSLVRDFEQATQRAQELSETQHDQEISQARSPLN